MRCEHRRPDGVINYSLILIIIFKTLQSTQESVQHRHRKDISLAALDRASLLC